MTKQYITFGVFIPQGWKMELVKIPTAAEKWQASVDIALRAEKLGFDSIWVYDHFHNVPRPAHEAVFECWTVMAAISQLTTKIRFIGRQLCSQKSRQLLMSFPVAVWTGELVQVGMKMNLEVMGISFLYRRIESACCAKLSRS
jgi:hypothetical protein